MSTDEFITYLNDQFPATIGHIPIRVKLTELVAATRSSALYEAAKIAENIGDTYRTRAGAKDGLYAAERIEDSIIVATIPRKEKK